MGKEKKERGEKRTVVCGDISGDCKSASLPMHNSLLIKVENCLANCKALMGGLLGTRL